jgi:hypothetical protein
MSKSTVIRAVVTVSILSILAPRPVAGQPLPVHAGTRLLRSGPLVVEVGDPESDLCRWNRGLRFSPVANVLRAQLHGQEFLYSPVAGGALSYLGGLAMEFDIGQEAFQPDPPGYNEGKSGDPFLKIGVGILRRDGNPYNFSAGYPVVELARTTATWKEDRVHFVQTLTGTANGYTCRLEQDVIVKNDRILMHYLLQNTGTKTFTTEQYLHNFMTFNSRPVGPNVRLSFPYDFTTSPEVSSWQAPTRRGLAAAAQPTVLRFANTIEYTEQVSSVPKIWVYKPEDYAGPDRFAVEHMDTRQRVIIESSIPAAYVGIWTTGYQTSPEQFVIVTLEPGQEVRFTRTYIFRVDGLVPEDSTGDGAVDVNDLAAVSAAWLSEPGTADWDPACDVSSPPDDRIDLHDLAALAGRWRQEDGLPAPLAHWRLDETAGAAMIDERGLYPGVLHHFPDDGSHWVAGTDRGGLQFDGIDDYVEIDRCPPIGGTAPRTLTAWIKLTERPTVDQVILAWGEAVPGRYWLLKVDTSRRLRFSCGAGFTFSSKIVGDTQWRHIAAVLDPLVPGSPGVGDVRLYVDGKLQIVYETAEHPIDTGATDNLILGASPDPSDGAPFYGIMDDIRIYGAALHPAHIDRIYREGLPQE